MVRSACIVAVVILALRLVAEAADISVAADVKSACAMEITRFCNDARSDQALLTCLRGEPRVSDQTCKDTLNIVRGERSTQASPGPVETERTNVKQPD